MISHLIERQGTWEERRGITQEINGRYNVDRIQVELDEMKVEEDPQRALEEGIDVLIILAGGLAQACKALGIDPMAVDQMVMDKLVVNDQKYHDDLFRSRKPQDAIAAARHYHALGMDADEIAKMLASDIY